MYIPEINFLAERTDLDREASAAVATGRQSTGGLSSSNVILGGVAILALLAAGFGGFYLWTFGRIRTLQAEQEEVTTELAEAQAELARLEQLQAELSGIQTRTQALRTFFERVQPWSAILEEIRNRIPPNTWISNMSTAENSISVAGQSLTFDQVNDFQLTLLQSPLIADVTIEQAIFNDGNPDEGVQSAVDYTLNVTLEDKPVTEYLPTLAARGSSGLVQKIELLRGLE